MDPRFEIPGLRAAVRRHRDQKGDDRCWLDDWQLWECLPESVVVVAVPDDAMERCRAYYANRRADEPDPVPQNAVLDPALWDADLRGMDRTAASIECARLKAAIRAHRDVTGRERTVGDDRALYAVLPENLPADFRLPSEDRFLGETLAPHAGCPAFWRSHANCPGTCHNLHRWGPCAPK